MRPAVFFDRDGVVNSLVDRGVEFELKNGTRLTSPWRFSEFQLFPGVREVVSAIKSRGYMTILATNQPSIANREMSSGELDKMHDVVRALGIGEIRVCPHNDSDACSCRKPKPGLILQAACELGIHLSSSYFVGDTESDIIAAAAAGCTGMLVRRPYNNAVQAPIILSDLSEILSYLPQV